MNLSRVEAASMQEALWKIKSTLGDNAMIVGTRTFRRGGVFGVGGREVVEVYVADTRQDNRQQVDALARKKNRIQELARTRLAGEALSSGQEVEGIARMVSNLREEIQQLAAKQKREIFDHPFLKDAYEFLLSLDVEQKLAERLVWDLKSLRLPVGGVDPHRVRSMVRAQIRKMFLPNVPTALHQSSKVLVLIGPTGVGKTTTIAKLAARAKINEGKKVALITLDTFRIAAVDQLQKYASIIGMALEVVSDPVEFQSAVKRFRRQGVDRILVDTAGRGQRDELKMKELREFLSVMPEAEIHLVLSTTTHPRTTRNIVTQFSSLGYHRLILTKLDETESFGSLLAALVEAGKPVSFLTDGQNVPEDIMTSDPERLAELVVRSSQG